MLLENMETHDIAYMNRALELARKGIGLASPNPTVGAVLVKDGQVIGEGFHQYDWRDHAEIVALKSAGRNAQGAALYVSFEPCCITGRTGPCTDAILRAKIHRVVAAMPDPNPAVAGRALAQLRGAGLAVETGVCEAEAHRLNEGFACWITQKRPFLTLKSALTLDGQLALPQSGKRKSATWITSEESRAEVHRMRHASDALLTGIGTILADDPLLTDRSGLSRRRKLLRVILDSRLRLPLKSKLVKTADEDVLVMTAQPPKNPRARALEKAGIEVFQTHGQGGRPDLKAVLRELGKRDILSVILEAGSALNGAALASGVVDKLFLFYAARVAGRPDVPFALANRLALGALENISVHRFGPDFSIEGYLTNVYRNH